MSSRTERWQTAIWLLADGLANANDAPAMADLRAAAARLKPMVLNHFDRAMKRVQAEMLRFIDAALETDQDGHITIESRQAYVHFLAATVSDCYRQMPVKPARRKAAWLGLNNAVVDLLNLLDVTGEVSVETGCQWADRLEAILKAA